ncbi:MAG: Hemerythrin HHE cation binding domain protein [Parcubacteria group bacterium GW2011_GWA1_42_7]|nr:MAG: Hemerythrin HHE cation binding domain protein [Parcubacteria group bacterium GW2011_GWA1_42_7]MBS3166826.1 hemerythrin domain-containing protein [Candidatus Woesearchaeota archaeon]
MSKIIQILTDEHKNILKVADILDNECTLLKQNKKIDKKMILEIVNFIRNYADKFHHAKEEDILFKEFCKNEEKLHCNPVEQMLYEHELGRGFVKGIEEGINKEDNKKVIENAQNYTSLIREHIFKEDTILYPMVDEILDNKTKEDMLKKFEKINSDRKDEIKNFENFANKK